MKLLKAFGVALLVTPVIMAALFLILYLITLSPLAALIVIVLAAATFAAYDFYG